MLFYLASVIMKILESRAHYNIYRIPPSLEAKILHKVLGLSICKRSWYTVDFEVKVG